MSARVQAWATRFDALQLAPIYPIYHCGPRYSSTACPYMHALLFSELLPLTAPHKRLRAMRGPPSVSVIWQFFQSWSWVGSRGSQWRGAVSLSPNSYNRTNNTFSPKVQVVYYLASFSPLPATFIRQRGVLISASSPSFLYVIPIATFISPPSNPPLRPPWLKRPPSRSLNPSGPSWRKLSSTMPEPTSCPPLSWPGSREYDALSLSLSLSLNHVLYPNAIGG